MESINKCDEQGCNETIDLKNYLIPLDQCPHHICKNHVQFQLQQRQEEYQQFINISCPKCKRKSEIFYNFAQKLIDLVKQKYGFRSSDRKVQTGRLLSCSQHQKKIVMKSTKDYQLACLICLKNKNIEDYDEFEDEQMLEYFKFFQENVHQIKNQADQIHFNLKDIVERKVLMNENSFKEEAEKVYNFIQNFQDSPIESKGQSINEPNIKDLCHENEQMKQKIQKQQQEINDLKFQLNKMKIEPKDYLQDQFEQNQFKKQQPQKQILKVEERKNSQITKTEIVSNQEQETLSRKLFKQRNNEEQKVQRKDEATTHGGDFLQTPGGDSFKTPGGEQDEQLKHKRNQNSFSEIKRGKPNFTRGGFKYF